MAEFQRYCFHIYQQNDKTTEPEELHCPPERIEQIQRLSVILKERINSHGSCQGIPLEIDNATDIDAGVIKYLVTDLPFKSGTNPGRVKPADLSKFCNAWWKYKWIPESAKLLWEQLDRSGIEGQNPQGTSLTRCWHHKTSNTLHESAQYLINITIVLGLDDNLREEMDRELRLQIQNVVWNSNLDAHLKTSVDFLHSIKDMWLKQLEAMFHYIFDQLVHLSRTHPRNVGHVRSKLKAEMGVDFYENWSYNFDNAAPRITTYSVYEFVGKIESILNGAHERHTHESGHSRHKSANGPQKPREGPNVDWHAVGKAALTGTASAVEKGLSLLKGSHESKWNGDLQQMFDNAHSHIQAAQESLTNKLIGLRKDELESWKKVLRDGETV